MKKTSSTARAAGKRNAQPAKEPLQAGFAVIDVTPSHPRGMSLAGMGRVYPGATGVHDPITVRASYIGTRSQGMLMVVLDVVFPRTVLEPHQDGLIAELARRTGLPPERVWITCTHCHSSTGEGMFQTWKGGDHYRLRTFSQYVDFLLESVLAVGEQAYRKRQAVEIGYAAAPVAQAGTSRRFKTSAGIVLSAWANGPAPLPGMRPVGRGVHDPDIGVIVFRDRRHRPIGAILNYNSHIHLYPTLKFTAETAGAVRSRMERKFPGLVAIYTNGAEGTTSLDAYLEPQSSRPEDWDRQYQRGLDAFSTRLMHGVESAMEGMSFASRVRMRCGDTAVSMRVLDVDGTDNVRLTQPLKALAIDDLALLGEQEEAWAEFSLGVKAGSPFRSTFVVGFVGFRNRYFPTAHGIEEGGYESQLLYRSGDGFAKTVRGAVKLLGTLRQEDRS